MNVRTRIVKNVGVSACERVSRKIRLSLQRMKEGVQSSEDSGLKNVWEEICVQIQEGQSPLWKVYDQTVQQLVAEEIKRLQQFEREAIWLQMDSGSDWTVDYGEDADNVPVIEEDVIRYVMDHFLYRDADNWSNKRVRAYMDRRDLDRFERDSSGA